MSAWCEAPVCITAWTGVLVPRRSCQGSGYHRRPVCGGISDGKCGTREGYFSKYLSFRPFRIIARMLRTDNSFIYHRHCLFVAIDSVIKWRTSLSLSLSLCVHPKYALFLVVFSSLDHTMKVDTSSIERVEEFKYLGTTLTNQNCIQEEIKSRLKSRNACYRSVQNLLSSSLLYKNWKIKIYRTIILPVVLYGCETWSLTLRQQHRLRVFENRVLRRTSGPKRDGVTGEWRKLHNVT